MVKKKKNKSIFSKFLIVIDILALICFFLAYGPFSFFRDYFITTAMTTMSHRYFAYVLYSEETVKEVLNNNKVIENDESTDTSIINTDAGKDTGVYESIYEEQVLKRDEGNDIYKIVDISGNRWNGYMVVIYDASMIDLVFSTKQNGEELSDMCERTDAYLGVNASGLYHPGGWAYNYNTGTTIKDGKIYYVGKKINKSGGLIGFTKDNVLMLTKKTAEEAIDEGMDRAVEFGPFLVVNGKETEFKGNGGWGIANRTAIGQRQDGIVLFMVINGRTSSSIGISMKELADLFVKYKVYNAANLDGGGSSTLYAKRTLTSKGELINIPLGYGHDGERNLPNAWLILPSSVEKYYSEKENNVEETTNVEE